MIESLPVPPVAEYYLKFFLGWIELSLAGLAKCLRSNENLLKGAMTDPGSLRLHRWHPSLLHGVGFSAIAAILIGSAVTSSVTAGQVFGAVTGLLFAGLGVRGFRSSTLLIVDGELVVRTLLRRRRWSLDHVKSASIERGYVGMYERAYPVLHLDQGAEYECREINTSPTKSGDLTTLVEAVNRAVLERSPRTAD